MSPDKASSVKNGTILVISLQSLNSVGKTFNLMLFVKFKVYFDILMLNGELECKEIHAFMSWTGKIR